MTTLAGDMKEATDEIVRLSVESNDTGDLSPFLEPRLESSLDEAVHRFLKDARRTPCLSLLESLRADTKSEEFRLCSSFRLIAVTESLPVSGGVTPLLSWLYTRPAETAQVGMSSRTDLQREGQRLEDAGVNLSSGKLEKKTSYRPKNRKQALAACLDDAGNFCTTLNETGRIAHEVQTSTSAPLQIISPLQAGLIHGPYLPVASGILAAVLVCEAMVGQIRHFFQSPVTEKDSSSLFR